MDPRAQTPVMDPRAQTLAMDQSTNPIDGSEHKPFRWIRAHTSRWIPEPKSLWWTPKRKIKHFFSLVLLVAILNLESFFVNTFLFQFFKCWIFLSPNGTSLYYTGVTFEILGTWVKLGFEKHVIFIYSLSMKTMPIHIFAVRKQYPFMYYAVFGNSLICFNKIQNKYTINILILHDSDNQMLR